MSSAGIEARQALRQKEGMVEALLYLVRGAIDQNHMDNKSVENVICVLRNLSYRCEEVVNPNYDKQPPTSSVQSRAGAQQSGTADPPTADVPWTTFHDHVSDFAGENQGCFGGSKKKKDAAGATTSSSSVGAAAASPSSPSAAATGANGGGGVAASAPQRSDPPKGMELLWQPDIVQVTAGTMDMDIVERLD